MRRHSAVGALLALFLVSSVSACGMSTHNEVVERALAWYGNEAYAAAIRENLAFVQPGAFFPDFGYSCGGYGSESEEAHWPRFTNASVVYMTNTFGSPLGSEESRQVAAFLFGVLSHAVSDASWHSLGMRNGIIHAMENIEFFGDFGDAHSVADTGGEFVLRHMTDLDYLQREWISPVEDMAAIFDILGYDVDPDVMTNCMRLGFVGVWGNQLAGELAFGYPASKSSILTNEYETYYLGGMNDMAAQTAHCWSDLARWLDDGEVTRPMCAVMENHWGTTELGATTGHGRRRTDLVEDPEALLAEHGYRVVSERRDNGRLLSMRLELIDESAPAPKREAAQSLPVLAEAADCVGEADFFAATSSFAVIADESFAQLGYAVASGDFDADGLPDLALGSPGRGVGGIPQVGGVEILSGADLARLMADGVTSILSSEVSSRLVGTDENSRFGHALAVVDLNSDGIDDLAVSAPHRNSVDMYYDGAVYVFFGQAGVGLSSEPSISVLVTQTVPPPAPGGTYLYLRTVLGTSLTAAHIDDDGHLDLVVGSANADLDGEVYQSGLMTAYTSLSGLNGTVDAFADSSLELRSEIAYEQFGSSVAFSDADGKRLLLVGAASHRVGSIERGVPSVGRVYAFDLDSGDVAFSLGGTQARQRLGAYSAIVDQGRVLAVAAPSEAAGSDRDEWSAGAVHFVDIDQIGTNSTIEDVEPRVTLRGSMRHAQLGNAGIAVDARGRTWISEPTFGPFSDTPLERGRILRIAADVSDGEHYAADVADLCVNGDYQKERFGSLLMTVDLNGSGESDLVVSALHYQEREGARLGGRVNIFFDV